MAAPALILASASPRRLDLLGQIGIVPAHVVPADIDETPRKNETPAAYAKRISSEKAAKIAILYPQDIVLAADTVVALGRRILPKAENRDQAATCLKLMSGRRHRVMTAVSLACAQAPLKTRLVTSIVQFKRLAEDEVSAYLNSEDWKGKAGGYAIQGQAAPFIPFISGSYSNIVGLPLHETAALLKDAFARHAKG